MRITIVTVTYGKRANLLRQVLDVAKAQGAAGAVVIDNGAAEPAAPWLAARYGHWAQVQNLGGNKGSAAGFKAGMILAQTSSAELILLLDDDNLPAPGCLRTLLDKWQNHAACGEAADSFAVHGLRTRSEISNPAAGKFVEPRLNSFLGFHIGEIPGKLFRRYLPALCSQHVAPLMRIAPYGGMMFHRNLLARIGLPDESYLLYVDDYEFSSRITASGGRIHLVPDAVIHDIDPPYTSAALRRGGNLFSRRLNTENLAGLYYATRNMTYFERYTAPKDHIIYALNGALFMAILTIMAFHRRSFLQYRIILQAIRDGDNRLRGHNPAYPL
jgi:GT2 family glycosyltransferase